MDTFNTIAALLLALIVFSAGLERLTTPSQRLHVRRPWTASADPRFVRALGTLEVAGAIGLIVPAVTGIAPVLVPVTAACLAVLMVGALGVEAKRHPSLNTLALPTATLVLAVIVAVGKFGEHAL
jgi:ABC-type Na+ efflux pump permease subunit